MTCVARVFSFEDSIYARAFLMSGRCRSASSPRAANVAHANRGATTRNRMGPIITRSADQLRDCLQGFRTSRSARLTSEQLQAARDLVCHRPAMSSKWLPRADFPTLVGIRALFFIIGSYFLLLVVTTRRSNSPNAILANLNIADYTSTWICKHCAVFGDLIFRLARSRTLGQWERLIVVGPLKQTAIQKLNDKVVGIQESIIGHDFDDVS